MFLLTPLLLSSSSRVQSFSAHIVSKETSQMSEPEPLRRKSSKKGSPAPPTWYGDLEWPNIITILGVPLFGILTAFWTPLTTRTAIWSVVYYFITGVGVTAGCHRLWSHSSFSATVPLKIYLAVAAAGCAQGSIRFWARRHRAHHRYTDTDKDPYSMQKGFFHAHVGWLLFKRNRTTAGTAPVSDLMNDPVVRWQHKHFLGLMIFAALVLPTLVAGLGWGDWWGGLVWAGIIRMFLFQQGMFCVNSLAHWLGEQPYDDRHSPRDHIITALITLGEGYHNFHHEFPADYRNTIDWYHYDPTKWCIWAWKKVGLAYDLKEFRQNDVDMSKIQLHQKKLDEAKVKLEWGTPLEQLPVMNWDKFQELSNSSGEQALVVIAGIVHDVHPFINNHPGGKALIGSAVGKDATIMFNGGVYDHSHAAHNQLAKFRVGIIRGGGEVEIMKRTQGLSAKDHRILTAL